MKKIILIAILAATLILTLFILKNVFLPSKTGKPKTYTITLTDKGFSPNKISIRQGDAIVFKTTRNTPFWPASNIHPTHLVYSEFDPKDAIMPDKTWSFTFNKVGKWGLHDHLAPYFIGKITVAP